MMKTLLVSLSILLSVNCAAVDNPFSKAAAENPFAQAPLFKFAKVFSSSDIRLELGLVEGTLEGTLRYESLGKTFAAKGELEDGVLKGYFVHEGQEFAYSFTLDDSGDAGVFETAGQRFRLEAGARPQAVAIATVAEDEKPAGFVMPEKAATLFAEAERLANSLDGDEREGALGHIAGELARAGDWKRAEEMAARLSNEIYRDMSYFTFTTLKAEEGDVEGAMRYFSMVRGDIFKGTTREYIPRAYWKAGDLAKAESFIDSQLSGGDRATLYARMANALATAGDEANAKRLIGKAETDAKRLSVAPGGLSMALILFYLRYEEFEKALTVLNEEKLPVLQIMQLAFVAEKYTELGRKRDALRMVDWAQRLAKKAGKFEKATFAGHLAKVQYLGGLQDKALENLAEITTEYDQRNAYVYGLISHLQVNGRGEEGKVLEPLLTTVKYGELVRFMEIQNRARRKGADLDDLAMQAKGYSDPAQLSQTLSIIAGMVVRPDLAVE